MGTLWLYIHKACWWTAVVEQVTNSSANRSRVAVTHVRGCGANAADHTWSHAAICFQPEGANVSSASSLARIGSEREVTHSDMWLCTTPTAFLVFLPTDLLYPPPPPLLNVFSVHPLFWMEKKARQENDERRFTISPTTKLILPPR